MHRVPSGEYKTSSDCEFASTCNSFLSFFVAHSRCPPHTAEKTATERTLVSNSVSC
jgi:hypothetical protein